MNLSRLGHYHTPHGPGSRGACQTALVTDVVEESPNRAVVNLVVWEKEGDSDSALGVRQDDPLAGTARGEATFHLGTECPWQR